MARHQSNSDQVARLDLRNSHFVAVDAGSREILIGRDALITTPEDALVLAAWLVRGAEPLSSVPFASVQDQIAKKTQL